MEVQVAIIYAMRDVVETASEQKQDALIKAHPDLAGKLALTGALTQSSTKEQAGAGLDQCTTDELTKFQKYNAAYKDKFGFPFIIAVSGLGRADILAAFETRLHNNLAAERKTALKQIHKIAAIRIRSWFKERAQQKEDEDTVMPDILPEDTNAPDFTKLTNLAATRLGTKVVYATDDFFADKSRLIDPSEPVFITDKYDDNGKWMDGWESRRKRVKGHDWAVIKLGKSGIIKGFEIDTAHFTGNFPPYASVEVANSNKEIPSDDDWHELIAKTDLEGDSQHFFGLGELAGAEKIWTHVRLHIYPDGGVARLRVYGYGLLIGINLTAKKP